MVSDNEGQTAVGVLQVAVRFGVGGWSAGVGAGGHGHYSGASY